MGHQIKSRGLSSFEAIFYTFDEDVEGSLNNMPDEVFSDLISSEIISAVCACAMALSETKYLKSNPKITSSFDAGVGSVIIKNWLNIDVLDNKEEPLFELLRDEGEDFKILVEGSAPILAIGIAAELIVKDICQLGNIFSEEWYFAKILQEYFWPKTSRSDQLFLIGMLWEQLAQKQKNEEFVLRGQSAIEADQRRGELGKSTERKKQRLNDLLIQMEDLVKLNPILSKMNPVHCGRQALDICLQAQPQLWAQGKGQLASYLTELASNQPYKKRFDAIFFQ